MYICAFICRSNSPSFFGVVGDSLVSAAVAASSSDSGFAFLFGVESSCCSMLDPSFLQLTHLSFVLSGRQAGALARTCTLVCTLLCR